MDDKKLEKLKESTYVKIDIYCKFKCRIYKDAHEKKERCVEYIKNRLVNNDFQYLRNYDDSKGKSESTYIAGLLKLRFIDFLNSADERRLFSMNRLNITNKNNTFSNEDIQDEDYFDFIKGDGDFANTYSIHNNSHDELDRIIDNIEISRCTNQFLTEEEKFYIEKFYLEHQCEAEIKNNSAYKDAKKEIREILEIMSENIGYKDSARDIFYIIKNAQKKLKIKLKEQGLSLKEML